MEHAIERLGSMSLFPDFFFTDNLLSVDVNHDALVGESDHSRMRASFDVVIIFDKPQTSELQRGKVPCNKARGQRTFPSKLDDSQKHHTGSYTKTCFFCKHQTGYS